ncbi:MAG TPA: helix-turn-helix domain-containing protein [Baekduia sp.]|jgi:cytoskeletal protein RodZ
MPEIGATLREARMRARIDISEIEAETKIRAKYLRALENEEWGLLPGPAYVRSFLRTYAEALDLDAKGLLEEYKLRHERPSDHDLMPIGSTRRRGGGGGRGGPVRHREPRRVPVGVVIGLIVVLLFGALYLLGRNNGNDDDKSASIGTQTSTTTTTPVPASTNKSSSSKKKSSSSKKASSSSKLVSLDIITTGPGPVSACLVDATGKLQIPGRTLEEKITARGYRSKSFHLKLGNGNVRLRVDGKIHSVPDISPVAYVITRKTFKRVDAATAPDCSGATG